MADQLEMLLKIIWMTMGTVCSVLTVNPQNSMPTNERSINNGKQ